MNPAVFVEIRPESNFVTLLVSKFIATLLGCLLLTCLSTPADGQQVPSKNSHPNDQPPNRISRVPADAQPSGKSAADAGDKIDQLLTRLALESIPSEFSDTKKWGLQTERWNGLEIERNGLRIETHRKKKLVNHGTWKKYTATLRNPNEEFQVQIKNIHESASGKLALELHVSAHWNIEARQAEWVKGVQLYNVNATGHASVRLQIDLEMGFRMGVAKFPPDLIFSPHATNAKITIDEFRIDRISKIGGEFTQHLSTDVKSKLIAKIGEHEAKLVDKINEQFEKKKDELVVSLSDAIASQWSPSLNGTLPDNVR